MLHNKIKYILMVTLIGILSILYNQYIMLLLFILLIILPMISFGLLCYCHGKISAKLLPVANVANKGDEIKVSIQITNPTLLPITGAKIFLTYRNAYTKNEFKKEFFFSIDQNSVQTVSFHLMSEFCGNIDFSLDRIRIYDYLKLFSLKRKQTSKIKVAILPNFYEMLEVFPTNLHHMVDSEYYSTVKSGDDPSEVFAIREYREGDRPSRIHWKLSAKQDMLMIKEFSEPLNCSLLIFLDLYINKPQATLSYMDALLESALSLSYSLIKQGQMHYFAWYDYKSGECKKVRIFQEKDFYIAVDGLLHSMPFTEGLDTIQGFIAENPFDQFTDLFYVTGDVSQERLDSLQLIYALKRQIIYVSDDDLVQEHFEKDYKKGSLLYDDIRMKALNLGYRLSQVNIGNMKSDMEELKLE